MLKSCEKKVSRRVKPESISLSKRKKGFIPVESGFQKDEAISEARRCLGTNACESCEVCSLFCPDLCITRDEESGTVLIDLDYCKGCGICAEECPAKCIVMVEEEK